MNEGPDLPVAARAERSSDRGADAVIGTRAEASSDPRPSLPQPHRALRYAPQSWRLRAAYAWEQSSDPRLIAARSGLDTRVRRFAAVVSAAGPAAPSIGYAGVPDGVVKILQLLEQRREALGAPTTAREWRVAGRAEVLEGRGLPEADLVAVGCSRAQAERLPRQSALVLPFRLHLVVHLSDEGDWRRRVSRRERQWFSARCKSGDLALDVATDERSFDFFYDRMHVPTMRLRHGDRARSEARESAYQCLFRDGLLAFVTIGGVRVAGVLCHRDRSGHTLTIRLLGVLDGSKEHYDEGAMKICYHLLLQWAERHGFRHVDLGGTEAWISKGIFQWKRRFAPQVVPAPNHLSRRRVWWHVRRDTPAVRDFLVANPVLEPDGEQGLRALYFYDDLRPARLDLAYGCANIDRHRVVHLDEFLASGVTLRSLGRDGART